VPALRDRLRAALLLLDPDGQADRAASERASRHVICRPISPTMGELIAQLPLEHLALIAARLDQAVQHARRHRDPRTADHVRTDTLTHLLTHDHTQCGDHCADATPGDATPTGAAPTGPAPSEPAPSEPARSEPGPADAAPSDPAPTDQTPAAPPPPASASPPTPETKRPGTCGTAGPSTGTGPLVMITIGLETLLGLRDDPGYLDRYGPIAADLARDLATHGTWRCAALDPTHGTLLGLGRPVPATRYVPSLRLQQLTHATYRTCTFPGCTTRATACDLDHTIRWPDGPTCSCNLHPACRRHHRMKTTGLLQVTASTDPTDPPGTLTWTTPTGRTYPAEPPTLTWPPPAHDPPPIAAEPPPPF
jgi:hypothetical protein